MAKNSDVITLNKLHEARKAKAKAVWDIAAKGFNHWTSIRDYIELGILLSVFKDDPNLPNILASGYFEVVEPEPCEKALSPIHFDPDRIALQPTEKGIVAYYWFSRYNHQQRRATDAAYIRGKKDVTLQIFENIANSVGLDFEELTGTGE